MADANELPVLRIVAKNVRGLKTEERLHELITELKTMEPWDIIILSETWRVEECEMFATNDGHLFANAGCEAGRRGAGRSSCASLSRACVSGTPAASQHNFECKFAVL